MGRKWTDEEDDYIREHYGSMTPEGIVKGMARITGHLRTTGALQYHAYLMGITQKDNQGKYSLRQLSHALGIDDRSIRGWERLGLNITKGVRCFDKRALMVAVDELVEFLQNRPELLNPDRCAPKLCREIFLNIKDIKTDFRWKRIECRNSGCHAVGRPLQFWAPIYEEDPPCPTCGRLVTGVAVGKKPKDRYAIQAPQTLAPIELLSTTKLAFLRSVEARGQATLREVGADLFGSELRGRGQRGIIRAVVKQGLVRKVARGKVREYSGPILLAYELTDAGREMLQQAADLKIPAASMSGPRKCAGCGALIVRQPGQMGALPKWCMRDHNQKPACPGIRKAA